MELKDKLDNERKVIEAEIAYLEAELIDPSTPESKLEDIQLEIDESNQELLLILSEIADEEERLKELKRPELLNRLKKVSQNNVAYVEVYGFEKHWGEHQREISSCSCIDELESCVVQLESALQDMEDKVKAEKVEREAKKAVAEQKLASLGISKEELLAILKG